MRNMLWSIIFIGVFARILVAEQSYDLHTILMNNTYKIVGDNNKMGTAFILEKPMKQDTSKFVYVLITAKHVLRGFFGDFATLVLRRKIDVGEYKKEYWRIPIREKGNPLWVEHDNADVAVLKIDLPVFMNNCDTIPIDILASDEDYKDLDIRTGDVLTCLGYPLDHEANKYGFPIARQGILASYPIYPAEKVGYFLIDLKVFKGNSGGPVYLISQNRRIGNIIYGSIIYQKILGLISSERIHHESYGEVQLDLGVVVPSVFILETINKLD